MEGTVIFSDLVPRLAFRRAQSSLIVPQTVSIHVNEERDLSGIPAIAFLIKKKRRSEISFGNRRFKWTHNAGFVRRPRPSSPFR